MTQKKNKMNNFFHIRSRTIFSKNASQFVLINSFTYNPLFNFLYMLIEIVGVLKRIVKKTLKNVQKLIFLEKNRY